MGIFAKGKPAAPAPAPPDATSARLQELRDALADALRVEEQATADFRWRVQSRAPGYLLQHGREALEEATQQVQVARFRIEVEERVMAEAARLLETAPARGEDIGRLIREAERRWIELLIQILRERRAVIQLHLEYAELQGAFIRAQHLARPGGPDRTLPGYASLILAERQTGHAFLVRLADRCRSGFEGDELVLLMREF